MIHLIFVILQKSIAGHLNFIVSRYLSEDYREMFFCN